MKRMSICLTALSLLMSAAFVGAVPLPDLPDLKVNGSDGPVSITADDRLSVSVSLDPGSASGTNADWWLVASTPFDWFHFGAAAGGLGWSPGLAVTHQGPLSGLSSFEVLNATGLPAGAYTFYFGVDTAMNGLLDAAELFYDRADVTVSAPAGQRLLAEDFQYLGAFRLPGGDTPPQTFAYGGNAMTFNPDGDPSNTDRCPGSLFVMGHDRQAWGALPDGCQVAEVTIPVPAVAGSPGDLPQAAFIQNFQNVAAGYFTQLDEIPKVGMLYLNNPDTGPKIHLAWGQHLQPPDVASHAWFNPNLATPDMQGVWFIGYQDLYSVNGYMFEIPAGWADEHANGRYIATGRFRDGGQGGMGPTIFAYRPWLSGGAPPASGTHLAETVLLLYENSYATENITRNMDGYQHADEWEGGAWITTASGKSAVLFAGTKANGTKYWYGYRNPLGPEYPCVDDEVSDFVTCRMADGASCPPGDFAGCCNEVEETCISMRGWWSTRFDAQLILYDPQDLARVAAGTMESWQPQPYTTIDIDTFLFGNPSAIELPMLGTGVQRRYRIGDVAYDRQHGLLYVLELFADEAKPVVHVWEVR
jgi:hypothetical protein